jgi:hypothetical protein
MVSLDHLCILKQGNFGRRGMSEDGFLGVLDFYPVRPFLPSVSLCLSLSSREWRSAAHSLLSKRYPVHRRPLPGKLNLLYLIFFSLFW